MSKNKVDVSPLFYYIFILIALGSLDHIYKTKKTFSFNSLTFVICPILWVIITKFAEKAIDKYFSGQMTGIVKRINNSLRWGIALFLFVFLMPKSENLYFAAYGILIFTISRAVFILLEIFRQYIITTAAVRSFLYVAQGVGWKLVFDNLWDGVWNLGIRVSVADMLLTIYLFLALFAQLSLLQLSENEYLVKAGRWFESGYFTKSLYVGIAFFLLKDVRSHLAKGISGQAVVVEWFLIFLCFGIFIFILMKSILSNEVSISHKDLKKHMLDLKFIKNNNMLAVSSYIDEFIEKGDISKILTYMAYLSKELNISTETAAKLAIQPLLEYKEPPMPAFFLKSELALLNEQNRQRRREIIENIIESMKQYRGKSNGYIRAATKM